MANWANVGRLGDPSTPEWQKKNLTTIEPIKGQRWQVYAPAAPAFQGLLNDLTNLGYHPISSGGFNYRNIRGGDQLSQHAFGTAIDLNAMANPQGQSASDIPHAAELAKKWGLDWGGNWSSNPDPMHFEYQGVDSGAAPQQGPAVPLTPQQIEKAFLDSIAQGESPGYDVMYGGGKFTDLSRHPHQAQTANGITSDVAGRYQFKGSTWDELAAKYGYKDFSASNQDAAAWQYAQDVYKQKTGGDLTEALQSNDPGRVNAAANVLNQTWSSLPGGKEQAKGYGDKTFYDIYSGHLNQGGAAAPAAAAAGGGGGGAAAPFTPAAAGAEKGDTFESSVGAAIKGMTGMAPKTAAPSAVPQLPIDYGAGAGAVPTVNAQMAEVQRQRLAEAMARLNSGQLWG